MTNSPFTPRQRDVLHALLMGLSTSKMALHLGIAETNVTHHLSDMCKKIKVPNRVALALWAVLNAQYEVEKILPLYRKAA